MCENCFLTAKSHLLPFMAFPRFLLEYDLNETAKVLYILLLDRARVSMKNDEWRDSDGHVYLHYTIKELAAALRKSEMTVKTALSALEEARLIVRRRTNRHQPSCIYVLMEMDPDSFLSLKGQGMERKLSVKNSLTDRKLSIRETEIFPSDGQNSFPLTDRKLSPNTNNRERIKEKERLSYMSPSMAFGQFHNVFLTEKQVDTLRQSVPGFENYVERLSRYMASAGKKYADHAATILDWAARDQRTNGQAKRDYSCQEGESL